MIKRIASPLTLALLAGSLSLTAHLPGESIALPPAQGKGVTLYGEFFQSITGFRVSGAGDLNGDGLADLVVSSYGDYGRGATYLVLGKSTPFPADLLLADVVNSNGTKGFIIRGTEDSDFLGREVSAAGDINGDGFDDLLIATRGGDGIDNLKQNTGEVYVVFGSASFGQAGAFAQGLDLSSIDGQNGFRIIGSEAQDYAGSSVASAGDINFDGFDDIIIGAYAAEGPISANSSQGAAYVLFGKQSGFPTEVELSSLESGNGSAGFVIFGRGSYSTLGNSVSGAGDVNGDGFADIIIGAKITGANERSASGESYVIFGKGTAFSPIINAQDIVDGNGSLGFAISGAEGNARAGSSVAGAGDVNGDGFADLIIGAEQADASLASYTYSGEAYLVFGKASGFGASLDLLTIKQGNVNAGVAIFGSDEEDRLGKTVSSAGDINGDGYFDLLLGTEFADGVNNTESYNGEAYVLFGKPTASFTPLIELNSLENSQGNLYYGVDSFTRTGNSVSNIGDFNGDGIHDFLIGGRGGAGITNTESNTGEAYVIFGERSTDTATYKSFAKTTSNINQQYPIGISGNGVDDRTPASQVTTFFNSGSATASLQTITVNRTNLPLSGFVGVTPGNVFWQLATTRTGNDQNAILSFNFSDADVQFLLPETLKLYKSTSLSGPWTDTGGSFSTTKNVAFCSSLATGYFTLAGEQDLVRPTVSFQALPSTTNSTTFNEVQITFSEPVKDLSLSDFQPQGMTISNLQQFVSFPSPEAQKAEAEKGNPVSEFFQYYTVDLQLTGGDGVKRFSILADSAVDAAGNGNDASDTVAITLDSTKPTVAFSSLPAITNDLLFPGVQLTFSEAITGMNLNDFTTSGVTVSNLQGSGTDFTVDLELTGADGTKSFALNADAVFDPVGNGNAVSSTVSLTLDTTPPVATLSTLPQFTNQAGFTSRAVSFSEPVTGMALDDFTGTGVTFSNLVPPNLNYTFDITFTGADGVKSYFVKAGAATDAAGNTNAQSNTVSTTLDRVAPESTTSTSDFTIAETFIQGTYGASDDRTGVSTVNLYIKVPNGNWANFGPRSGNTWTHAPVVGDGAYSFATVATDNAGNVETIPTGSDSGDFTVLFNDFQNSSFDYNNVALGEFIFPMTNTLDVKLVFGEGSSGVITLARGVGQGSPDGANLERFINERIVTLATFTGSYMVEWPIDPISDNNLVGPLNKVFQVENGFILNTYPATFSNNTITFGPVTGTGIFYAGNDEIAVQDGFIFY